MRWTRYVAGVTAIVMTTFTMGTRAMASDKPLVFHAPAPQSTPVHARNNAHYTSRPLPATAHSKPADTAWPAAADATVTLGLSAEAATTRTAGAAASAPAATSSALPVTLAPVAANAAKRAGATGSGAASTFDIKVLGHAQASAAGVPGVVFTLTPHAGTAAGAVKVGVDYASFRNAGGADYADRLHLVELPACVLTTPRLAACRVPTPLSSTNDSAAATVSAKVSFTDSQSTASPSGAVVMALAAGASGSNGDFTATPISPSGTWSSGGASGDFDWSYALDVPAPAAGPTPKVSLAYNSSNVDGRQATTNNQFGMIGEGFTLSDSYISRAYTDCADDPEGAIAKMYDNCWAGQVVTMVLDGRSTPLIVDANGVWHEQTDSGDLVQYEKGTDADTGNGTYDNGYWVVTSPDGTKYYFGKNKGPGWASGDPTTNSAWTEPVYGAHPGDPCNNTAGFAQSSCSQAWQWNLDFAVDIHGNTSAYYYQPEVGYYGADNKTTPVAYDRAGYPTEIDYGMREESGSIYGTSAPRKVVFGKDLRCFGDATTCAFTSSNTTPWDDTPVDQICASSGTCNNHAPTFYTEYRIDDISTEYYPAGTTTPVRVDDYALNQSFSTAGDDELLLNSITRTGGPVGGANDIALPPVNLEYQLMDNRIPGYNTEPAMAHWRLTNIETETGEITAVTYSTACTTSQIPSDASQNTSQCYPVKWTPPGTTGTNPSPILDYFDKYVVSQIATSNAQQQVINGTPQPLTPTQITNYTYPTGAVLWHYDDNQLVKAAYRTYGQFRGYPEVDSYTGDTTDTSANGTLDQQTETKTWYYRGMDGDQLPSGTRSATVQDTLGDTYTDSNAFADQVLETQTLTGVNGSEVSAKVTTLGVVATTGSMAVSGLPTVTSTVVAPTETREVIDLAAGGTEVKTTKTSYDSAGRAVLVDVSGPNIAESCKQTSYAGPTPDPGASPPTPSPWITRSVDETITASGPCPASPGGIAAANILNDTRTYFDGSTTLGAAPSLGDETRTDRATTDSGGTLAFQTDDTRTYDAMGRVLTDTNARGEATTTTYTPADGGILTAQSSVNVLNQTSSKTFDPARGSELTSTDVAGLLTSGTYDALGRVTAAWRPGRSQANGDSANVTYAYLISQSVPNVTTTSTLVDYGTGTNYLVSTEIEDSRGQSVQTQTTAAGGETLVVDTLYDSHGWKVGSFSKYATTGNPSTTEIVAQQADFNDVRLTIYDAAGRATQVKNYNGTTLTDSATTIDGGDRSTVITYDASGNVIGTPTTTVKDLDGDVTVTGQYTAAPTVSGNVVTPAAGSTMQATTTTYNAIDAKTKVTDPSGNAWTYTYDLLGREIQTADPDAGATTNTYDADGNLASSTDANGTEVNYVYDQLDRKSAEYTGSTTQGSGTKIATWNYDTLRAGKLYYSTSTNPTTGLTYQSGVTGYDAEGDVAGTWVTIPKTGATAGLGGTYTTTYSYTTTGLMTYDDPAVAGGLASEDIDYTYDQYGDLKTEGLHGYDVYASGATYSPFGQLTQIQLGSGPSAGSLSYNYDPRTGKETQANLSVNAAVPQVDNTAYTYNADQQMISSTDTEGGSGVGAPVETQCFTYDMLDRLNAAWSGTDKCAADPFTVSSNATVGGPQPYAQAWTFDALGDRKTETDLAPAGGTGGTTTTMYTYATAGHAHALSSTTSSNTVTGTSPATTYGYDKDGQTNSRASGGETLTWTPNGQLATDTKGTSVDSYVYDADGTQLIESDTSANSETLFLPGEQITYNTGSAAKTGVRYYTFDGVTFAESTGTAGTLYWLETNSQNTASVAVNAFSNNQISRRIMNPYGNAVTGSATWIDQKGFLGDQQTPTGLVDIGARKYDSVIGAFISVDPALDALDPQTMTGYEYSADDPVNTSDPTGKWRIWSLFSLWENGAGPTVANIVDTTASAGLSAAPLVSNFGEIKAKIAERNARLAMSQNYRSPAGARYLNAGRAAKAGSAAKELLESPKWMTRASTGLSIAGGLIGGWSYFNGDTEPKGESHPLAKRLVKSAEVAAFDTGTSIGVGMGGELATAFILGSSLGPVGTVAAVAGVVLVSAITSTVLSNVASSVVNTVSSWFGGW